jgi:hypothetical protein
MRSDGSKAQRKSYEKPSARKLTREQAKLRLMGLAVMGSKRAKALLDVLFEKKDSEHERPA